MSNLFDKADKIIGTTLLLAIILSGGKPISPLIYKALEHTYGVEVPTYSIPELMDTVDRGNKYMAMSSKMSKIKISVESFEKLQDLMKTKNIKYTQIAGYKAGIAQLKVEGKTNILRLEAMTNNINLQENLVLSIEYLNEEEVVVTMKKGD